MELFFIILFIIIGIALIVKGGDFFVDAASWIAEASGIPQFIIGATIVSVATTLPEMIVSIIAAAQGKVEMAIGNAIGSVTANTGLILAIALIFSPFIVKRSETFLKSITLLVSIALLFLFSITGFLNVWLAIILLIPFAVFLWDNIAVAKKEAAVTKKMQAEGAPNILYEDSLALSNVEESETDVDDVEEIVEVKKDKTTVIINILKFIFGAGAIVLGAKLLVDNGSALATIMKIPEGIIAVTLVAIGTSLPELVTMVTSLIKKKGAMSAGNILGANIIDITLILPICAIISGGSLPVSFSSLSLDFPFCLGIAAIAFVPTLFTSRFSRWQGILMILAYITYITLRIVL